MRRRRFGTLEWIAAGIVALFVLAAVFPNKVEPAHGTICLSNLKHLAIADLIYANDYDDRLPRRLWKDALWPYLKDERPFHDPVLPKGGYGYAMNSALRGANLDNLKDRPNIPLVFDSTVDAPNAVASVDTLPVPGRHGGRNSIACADGHVHQRHPKPETDAARESK